MTIEIKEIHIGEILLRTVTERGFSEERLCKFFECDALGISEMYNCKSMDTLLLLRWSKLLEYDFFRLYSQHLMLYAPGVDRIGKNKTYATLPNFRKHIYRRELTEYMLEQINKGAKTKNQIIEEYGVPRSTLLRWLDKKHEYIKTE